MITTSKKQVGSVLVYLVVIIFIFPLLLFPLVTNIARELKFNQSEAAREQALQIAEAGINYYQWHLAHFPSDYKDGTNGAGPYIHSYTDVDTAKVIGQYSLTVTPPPTGSTIITIRSTGTVLSDPTVSRTITAKYGIPSLAVDAFLSNDIVWIGSNESINGQLQSNNGIRFDGTTNAPVLSAKATYTCPVDQGNPCPALENGIWGSAPASSKSFWQFPVPAVDFSTITANLSTMKTSAQSGGLYLPPSNSNGYSLVFNNNGTVSVYKVTRTYNTPKGYDVNGATHNEGIDYRTRTLQFTQAIPLNGIIYIEDNVWVEGTVNGRVSVAAAELPYNPATAPTIYIPDNIVYNAKDGSSVLGLLAQNNVVVTYNAPDVIEIDGVLAAQNGSVQIFNYPGKKKTTITVFGSIITYGQWTWTWVNNGGNFNSGYATTYSNYDSHLLYGPPPGFPLSSSGYKQLSWISN